MKALKCKPSAQFAYNYTINVLSRSSNIISHRSSIGLRTIDLRRSAHLSSIFDGRHIDRRSSKVDTSIFEGRHIDHRSLKVDTSIFEDRRWKHRTDNPTSHRHSDNSSPNIVYNGAPWSYLKDSTWCHRCTCIFNTHAHTRLYGMATAPHVH